MDQVTYPPPEIIKVLRSLNEIVVSLDRIGSCAHEMTADEYNLTLTKFVESHAVFRKLAEARRILSEPFPKALGPDDMDELEREMHGITYWRAPKPPNATQPV